MKKKMLQFVDLKQETPEKEVRTEESVTSKKYIMNTLLIKLKNNQAGVLSAVSLFVRYIAL